MKRIALFVPLVFLLAACNRAPQEVTPTPTRPAAVGSPPAAQALVTATLPLSTPIGGRALATAAPAGSATPVGTARVVATAALPAGTPAATGAVRALTTAALPAGTPAVTGTVSPLTTAALPAGTPAVTGTARALTTATLPAGTPASGAALPLSTAALPVGTPSAGATTAPQLAGTPAAGAAYPAPTSAALGAQAPATRYDAADAGISFDVPVGWQRQPGTQWLFAPTGATSPQLGLKWADMGQGWQPTSMLPAGATVLTMGALNVPLGNATVFILPGAGSPGAGNVAQAGEIHVIVQTPIGRAYDFYGTANRVEDLLALQPALLQMVTSATPRR